MTKINIIDYDFYQYQEQKRTTCIIIREKNIEFVGNKVKKNKKGIKSKIYWLVVLFNVKHIKPNCVIIQDEKIDEFDHYKRKIWIGAAIQKKDNLKIYT